MDKDNWKDRVFAKRTANEWGAPRIRAALVDDYGEPPGIPSERTVGNYLVEWNAMSPEDRRQWGFARWPESIQNGSLSPEAARPLLDLLQWHRERGLPRPSVRLARLFALVRQGDPDTADATLAHLQVAAALVYAELKDDAASRRMAEWALAYRPWRGAEQADAYEKAVRDGAIPAFELKKASHARAETEEYPDLWGAIRTAQVAGLEALGLKVTRATRRTQEEENDEVVEDAKRSHKAGKQVGVRRPRQRRKRQT